MFCLRSWLPLLFIPTNASPMFIFLFFICTYFLNRPCVYCSFLLLILFASSCHWSDHCFFDFSSNWFEPRYSYSSSYLQSSASAAAVGGSGNATAGGNDFNYTSEYLSMVLGTFNQTAVAIAGSALDEARRRVAGSRPEWTGIGVEWLRSLLGKREWRVPCVDVYIRL
ncbi:bladder cancer-related protein BC10-domain-containing protein [Xylogone sp. PMI_703]|nr:bladder cancer-related protein BC10-domain-containing protein [Xylogone sp. PMI_703]